MSAQSLSEWLASLPVSDRITALALMYSNLTVGTLEDGKRCPRGTCNWIWFVSW